MSSEPTFSCPHPWWKDGYLSPCLRDSYFSFFFPIAAALLSLCLLCLRAILLRLRRARPLSSSSPASGDGGVGDAPPMMAKLRRRGGGGGCRRMEIMAIAVDVLIVLSSVPGPLGYGSLAVYLLALAVATRRHLPHEHTAAAVLRLHLQALYSVQWVCIFAVRYNSPAASTNAFTRAITLLRLGIYTALLWHQWTTPRCSPSCGRHEHESNHPDHEDSSLPPPPSSSSSSSLSSCFCGSPEETASPLSWLLFTWAHRLLWKAFRAGTIQDADLFPLHQRLSSASVHATLLQQKGGAPSSSSSSQEPSLLRLLGRVITADLLRQGAWAAVTSVLVFAPPLLIKLILEYLEDPEDVAASRNVWLYVWGLLVASLVAGIADCHCSWVGTQVTTKVRVVLLDQIYAKILRRRIVRSSSPRCSSDSSSGPQQQQQQQQQQPPTTTTDGAIYNFVSGDIQFISSMAGSTYLVWVTFPVQITIGTTLLCHLLGPSGLVGVLAMLLLTPLNVALSRRMARVQARVLVASDARIQASTELLHAYRTIKYYAWEGAFRQRVLATRRAELGLLRSRFLWWSVSSTLFFSLPFIVTIITCFFYTVVWGHDLGFAVAFPALATFAVIKIPLNRLADSIAFLIQAYVSLARINHFLQEPEVDKEAQLSTSDPPSFGFDHASFTWSANATDSPRASDEESPLLGLRDAAETGGASSPFRLQDLTIDFHEAGLNVICGPSGSGKSSLLLALLGEMHLERGRVLVPHRHHQQHQPTSPPPSGEGESNDNNTTAADDHHHPTLTDNTAYCPHEPWILNQSIRANILLNHPFNAARYEAVLRAVALDTDLAMTPSPPPQQQQQQQQQQQLGDQASAGENGSKLSGGQRQRVSLARALYSPCRYVLLDDCLSALDARTARHVLVHGLRGPLMAGRTCVLATHHVRLVVPQAARVVLLEGGRVQAVGTPAELVAKGVLDVQTGTGRLMDDDGVLDREGEEEEEDDADDSPVSLDPLAAPRDPIVVGERSTHLRTKTTDEEDRAEGAVSWTIVRGYLRAMGPRSFWLLVAIGFVAQQVANLGTNLWIREWAFQYEKLDASPTIGQGQQDQSTALKQSESGRSSSGVSAGYYLAIYTALCLAYALITLLRDLVTFTGSLKASTYTYERLLDAVLAAKLSFFDRPLGQITNRFTKDMTVVDQSLAAFAVGALQIATTVAMVLLVLLTVLPGGGLLPFLLRALVLALVVGGYALVTALYLRGAQDLKRREAVARSPLYQHVGESIAGSVSIRAYGQQGRAAATTGALVDGLHQPSLLLAAAEQWLKVRVDMLSSLITFVAGVLAVTGAVTGAADADAGAAGLVLTYAVTFTENMLWFVTLYAIIQQDLTSVERIGAYMQSAAPEARGAAPGKTLSSSVPEAWPTQGSLAFRHFTARYAPAPAAPVLRDITLVVAPGQRVAVVGRTGAGKSSLALALLRALEADDSDNNDNGSGQGQGGCGGCIEIDGVDIATVEVARLRGAAVTMIAQEPHLFDGSVRANLDPLGQHTEEEMRDVLRSMRASDHEEHDAGWDLRADVNLNLDLDLDLDRDASTLSRGQCQLLCLARGLLRKSRVLILDEATANVDQAADAAIQAGLRATVARTGATVLTVAHRLLTIVDYDRVIVLEAGRVVEQGSVRELLAREGDEALFRRLCEQSGEWAAIQRAVPVSEA